MSGDDTTINCRLQSHDQCYHGADQNTLFGPDAEPWRDDGTYDPDTDTIVCDPCYVKIGSPGIAVDHPDARTFGRNIGKGDPR